MTFGQEDILRYIKTHYEEGYKTAPVGDGIIEITENDGKTWKMKMEKTFRNNQNGFENKRMQKSNRLIPHLNALGSKSSSIKEVSEGIEPSPTSFLILL